jgi:hypothetical protein
MLWCGCCCCCCCIIIIACALFTCLAPNARTCTLTVELCLTHSLTHSLTPDTPTPSLTLLTNNFSPQHIHQCPREAWCTPSSTLRRQQLACVSASLASTRWPPSRMEKWAHLVLKKRYGMRHVCMSCYDGVSHMYLYVSSNVCMCPFILCIE